MKFIFTANFFISHLMYCTLYVQDLKIEFYPVSFSISSLMRYKLNSVFFLWDASQWCSLPGEIKQSPRQQGSQFKAKMEKNKRSAEEGNKK